MQVKNNIYKRKLYVRIMNFLHGYLHLLQCVIFKICMFLILTLSLKYIGWSDVILAHSRLNTIYMWILLQYILLFNSHVFVWPILKFVPTYRWIKFEIIILRESVSNFYGRKIYKIIHMKI